MNEDRIKEGSAAEKAVGLFNEGYNCAQAVMLAFEDRLPYDRKTLASMASSFGGGMGRLREVCGAMSAVFMIVGMLRGYDGPETGDVKKQHYSRIQALGKQFEKEHEGTMICRELLHLNVKHDTATPEERTKTYYETRPCPRLVGDAAAMLEEFLRDEEAFIARHEIEM